jgi:hypothetical protein
MKQTRRGFLGRVATIAAAVSLAPAAKVEAVPARPADRYVALMDEYKRGLVAREDVLAQFPELRVLDEARWPTEAEKDADYARFMTAPLTFEAMQADCAARGCSLEGWLDLYWDPIQYRAVHAMAPRLDPDEPHALFSIDHGTPGRLERLDAWRRGLHEQEPTIVASLGNGVVANVHVNDDGSWRLCQPERRVGRLT